MSTLCPTRTPRRRFASALLTTTLGLAAIGSAIASPAAHAIALRSSDAAPPGVPIATRSAQAGPSPEASGSLQSRPLLVAPDCTSVKCLRQRTLPLPVRGLGLSLLAGGEPPVVVDIWPSPHRRG